MISSACFVFNDTAATEIYTYCHTLPLHDALPISTGGPDDADPPAAQGARGDPRLGGPLRVPAERSEEHTSELQSLMRISYAVFCLKKKRNPRRQQQKPR